MFSSVNLSVVNLFPRPSYGTKEGRRKAFPTLHWRTESFSILFIDEFPGSRLMLSTHQVLSKFMLNGKMGSK